MLNKIKTFSPNVDAAVSKYLEKYPNTNPSSTVVSGVRTTPTSILVSIYTFLPISKSVSDTSGVKINLEVIKVTDHGTQILDKYERRASFSIPFLEAGYIKAGTRLAEHALWAWLPGLTVRWLQEDELGYGSGTVLTDFADFNMARAGQVIPDLTETATVAILFFAILDEDPLFDISVVQMNVNGRIYCCGLRVAEELMSLWDSICAEQIAE